VEVVRPDPAPQRAPGLVPLRILVVDDDPDVLEAAGLALSHLGQDAELTSSGAEAVARFMRGERYDLVLCDIGMPQLDGWHVAREVRSIAPGARLYLISGWAREIAVGDVERAGAAGLLAKPLSLDALRTLLAEEAARCARQVIRVGDATPGREWCPSVS
jgi:two-component system CheB/CheR fusion protein